ASAHDPQGALTLEAVSFGYARGKPPTVADLSIRVEPGTQIGVSGPTGCGKSTLGGLLAGLHRPWSGEATLGGVPLGRLSRAHLARTWAWLGREPLVFGGPLRENLLVGGHDVTGDALDAAIRDAALGEVI